MKEMSDEIFRNYIDCQWFTSANKGVFLTMILFQIMMALNFNSIIDVPILIFVVLVFSCFPQRKTFPRFYQCYVFFVAYSINLVSIVKVFYAIIVQIPYIQEYFVENKT